MNGSGWSNTSGVPRVAVRGAVTLLLILAAGVLGPPSLHAQDDERELGWFYDGELTFVLTAGNARANTFGFGAGVRRVWERTELRLRGGGLRTESGTVTRTAVGTPTDFEVTEDSDLEVTAQNYYARSRLEHSLSGRFFVYGGAGWERNTFAGFDGRWTFAAGAGNSWVDTEAMRFLTDYAVTYTIQDDVIDDPATSDSFAGLRLGAELYRRLTGTTGFLSELTVDESLGETDDWRADWTNSVQIDISRALALRTGLQLLYDHRPSLTTVPLEQPAGTPTGQSVQVPLDELDTRFSVALVASF